MPPSEEATTLDIFRISISDLFHMVEYLLTNYTDTYKYANRFFRHALSISSTDFDVLEKWKRREDSKIETHKVESFYRNLILVVERFATDNIDDIEETDPIYIIFKGLIHLSVLSRYYDFGITCMKVIAYHYESSNYRHREYAKFAMKNTFPSIFKRFTIVTNAPKPDPRAHGKSLSIQSAIPEVPSPRRNGIGCCINNVDTHYGKKKITSVIRLFSCKSARSIQSVKSTRRVSIKHQLDVEINEACLAYITSFATINSDISEFLSDSVIVTTKILYHTPWSLEALKLTRMACKSQDNSIRCLSYGLNVFMNTLNFNYKKEPPDKVISFSFILSIISSFLKVKHKLMPFETTQLCNTIYSSNFYVKILFEGIRSIVELYQPTIDIQCHHVFLCVEMMKCLYLIFKTNHDILLECCYSFHIIDILLVALKESEAQPEILAASAEGITVILGFEDTRNEFIEYIAREASYFVPILSHFQVEPERYFTSLADVAKLFNLFLVLANDGNSIAKEITIQLENNGLYECLLDGVEMGGITGLECTKCLSLCKNYTIDIVTRLMNVMGTKSFFDDICLEMIGYIIKIFTRVISSNDIDLPDEIIGRILDSIILLLTTTLLMEEKLCFKNAMFTRSCAAQFILTLGFTEMGRELLNDSCDKISRILFLEQENCQFNHVDLPVERIYNGLATPLIGLAMVTFIGETPGQVIRPNVKQAFRVMSALADYCQNLCDSKNIYDLATVSSDEFLNKALSDCLDREREFFSPFNISLNDVDNNEFSEYNLCEKLLDYLSKGRDPINYGVMDKSSSEYFVGLLKGDKLTFEKEECKLPLIGDWFVKNFRGDISTGRDLEQAINDSDTSMLLPCKLSLAASCGITLANYQQELTPDVPMNKILPTNLVWSNCYLKQLNSCYIVAAYLRCLYGLLHSNTNNVTYLCGKFKQPGFVRKLIILIMNIPLLECNVYSKFFAVTSKALTFEPSQQVESMDMAVVYDIISRLCNRAISTISSYLSTGPNALFDFKMPNLLLFVENLLKLLYLLVFQTQYIKFSEQHTIQQWCVEKCLNRFISSQTLEFIHMILNHILTMEIGSFRGTFVAHFYDLTITKSIECYCLKILEGIISICPSLRFQALYKIIEARESGAIMYRRTLIDDLLMSSFYERYRIAYQGHIAEVENIPEPVTFVTKIVINLDDKFSECLLMLSGDNIHLLDLVEPSSFDSKDDFKFNVLVKYPLKDVTEVMIYESNSTESEESSGKIVATNLSFIRFKMEKQVDIICAKPIDLGFLLSRLGDIPQTVAKLPSQLFNSINITTLKTDKYDVVLGLDWENLTLYTFDWTDSLNEIDVFKLETLESVTFEENLTIQIKFQNSEEKSLSFLCDYSLQVFKRALAQGLNTLENSGKWKRTIDFPI